MDSSDAVVLTATAATLGAAVAPASATADPPGQAATAERGTDGAYTVRVTGEAARSAQAAPPPTTSPPAGSRTFIPNGGGFDCAPEWVCAGVPYGGGIYLFKFRAYARYGLSNWFGTGFVINNQTGRAAARLEDNNLAQRACIPSPAVANGIGWDPIWYIRLTAAPC